jgi:hypothetical protein
VNIILAGIIGRYPYAGVTWCSLMYLLGLRQLGHNVWYLEDTGECNIDPVANTISKEPTYALRLIDDSLRPFGLGDSWCYIDYTGRYYGHDRAEWLRVCRDADLYINLSGGSWFWRDEYARIPHSAFIDSDPGFTQLSIARGAPWWTGSETSTVGEFFARFGTLFTFGRNIGTPACDVPTGDLMWHHTWQPVCMDQWQPTAVPPRDWFTTVMTWQIESFTDIGGNKDRELIRFLDLPRRSPAPFELAVNGPREFLRSHGWRCIDAFDVSANLDAYRNYLQTSRGEFSVAKHTYVRTNSGWFSDRTECYLASGRPAIVQDTGFSAHVPCGEGLFAFRDPQGALDAIANMQADYARHSKTARDIAAAHFAAEVVLPPLLETATTSSTPSMTSTTALNAPAVI